jgi:hypothetical protein
MCLFIAAKVSRHSRLERGSSAEQPAPDLIRGLRGIRVFIAWTRDAGSPLKAGMTALAVNAEQLNA